jgi:hypothetical protein
MGKHFSEPLATLAFLAFFAIVCSSSVPALGQMCDISQVRDVARKALFQRFTGSNYTLTIEETWDLTDFFNDNRGLESADCSVMGKFSGEHIFTIVQKGSGIDASLPVCVDGTEYASCSSADKPLYCYAGNLVSRCDLCGCASGKVCQQNGKCAAEGGGSTTAGSTSSSPSTSTSVPGYDSCDDTDMGIVPDLAGVVTAVRGNMTFTFNDSCIFNESCGGNFTCAASYSMDEYYCGLDNAPAMTEQACPYGCLNGNCITGGEEPTTILPINDSTTTTIPANGTVKPDIVLKSISLWPAHPNFGETLFMNITFDNEGNATADAPLLGIHTCFDNPKASISGDLGYYILTNVTLVPGQQTTFTANTTISRQGTYEIGASVDVLGPSGWVPSSCVVSCGQNFYSYGLGAGYVDEWEDNFNNRLSASFQTLQYTLTTIPFPEGADYANLQVTGIEAVPAVPHVGENTMFRMTVKNNGTINVSRQDPLGFDMMVRKEIPSVNTKGITYSYGVGFLYGDSLRFFNVSAGQERQITPLVYYNYSFKEPGRYWVSFVIDTTEVKNGGLLWTEHNSACIDTSGRFVGQDPTIGSLLEPDEFGDNGLVVPLTVLP